MWRTAGPRVALRAARWRIAGRVGRVLLGGEIARLESRVADAEDARRVLEARFADLVAMMVGVRERTLAAERDLAALRAELARTVANRGPVATRREPQDRRQDAADA